MKGALWQLLMLVIRPLSKHLFLFVIMGKMKKTIPRLAFASFCPKIMSIYIHQSLTGSIFCCICNNIIYILTEKYIHLCLYYTWANEMKEKKSWNGLSSKMFVTCITRFLYVVLIFQLYWQISFHCIYMYMQPFHWLLLGQTFRILIEIDFFNTVAWLNCSAFRRKSSSFCIVCNLFWKSMFNHCRDQFLLISECSVFVTIFWKFDQMLKSTIQFVNKLFFLKLHDLDRKHQLAYTFFILGV